jgi:hypothetical protein
VMVTVLGTLQHTVLPAGQQVFPCPMLPNSSSHCTSTGRYSLVIQLKHLRIVGQVRWCVAGPRVVSC